MTRRAGGAPSCPQADAQTCRVDHGGPMWIEESADERLGWRGFLMPLGAILGLAGLVLGIWFLIDRQASANAAALIYDLLGQTSEASDSARRRRQPDSRQARPRGGRPARRRWRHLALLRGPQCDRHATEHALAPAAAAVGLRRPCAGAAHHLPRLAGRLDDRQERQRG